MNHKISSPLTEFYKVYGVFCIFIFFAVFGFDFFDPSDFAPSIFLLLLFVSLLFIAFDFWRMKEVEMTETGLLISRRFLFSQQIIFVPYEKVKSAKRKFWWLGNNHLVSIKFLEKTEFGEEIKFASRGMFKPSYDKILEDLNRAIFGHKISEKLNVADNQIEK